jgi:uncharacterized protein (DUF2249 family)
MRPTTSRPIDAMASALVVALRRLGEAGDPVAASRVAAEAYASVRHEEPRIAERLNGVMHHLARLEAAASRSERSQPVTDTQILDVRELPPIRRHAVIFETFDALPVGGAFELVNDHDPKPLYYQLAAEQGGTFDWQYLEQGPTVWRVRIARTAAADDADSPAARFGDKELPVAGGTEAAS